MIKPGIAYMLALVLSVTMMLATQATASERYGTQKVVYHINYDDPKLQAGALRNIQNHINAVGAKNIEIKVVLHGNGLALLVEPDALQRLPKFKHANADETMAAKIDGLKAQGVTFNICANTVKGRGVNIQTDLYNADEADIVPSGVAEVAYLQANGYTYVKP
jgi:intracellular sulfur oxidation DsrE/DsrF family protein